MPGSLFPFSGDLTLESASTAQVLVAKRLPWNMGPSLLDTLSYGSWPAGASKTMYYPQPGAPSTWSISVGRSKLSPDLFQAAPIAVDQKPPHHTIRQDSRLEVWSVHPLSNHRQSFILKTFAMAPKRCGRNRLINRAYLLMRDSWLFKEEDLDITLCPKGIL